MIAAQAFKQWCGDDWGKELMEDCWEAACKWQREQIADQFADAIQSDLENGVKSLNEAATNSFKRGYPELNKLFATLNQEKGEHHA